MLIGEAAVQPRPITSTRSLARSPDQQFLLSLFSSSEEELWHVLTTSASSRTLGRHLSSGVVRLHLFRLRSLSRKWWKPRVKLGSSKITSLVQIRRGSEEKFPLSRSETSVETIGGRREEVTLNLTWGLPVRKHGDLQSFLCFIHRFMQMREVTRTSSSSP